MAGMQKQLSAMFEADVRAENLIWIPSVVLHEDSYPDIFESFIDTMPLEPSSALYVDLPALTPFAVAEDGPEPYQVAAVLLDTPGFLVQAATPIYRYSHGGSYTYSWGAYYTEWLYVVNQAGLPSALVAWAAVKHEHDRTKIAA